MQLLRQPFGRGKEPFEWDSVERKEKEKEKTSHLNARKADKIDTNRVLCSSVNLENRSLGVVVGSFDHGGNSRSTFWARFKTHRALWRSLSQQENPSQKSLLVGTEELVYSPFVSVTRASKKRKEVKVSQIFRW